MKRFAWLALLLTVSAYPQSKTTAVISGTITDSSAAVIPGARVSVTSAETGTVRDATADERGEYRVLLLPPGTYEVKAEQKGFATQAKKGVTVTVGQTAVIDFRLSPGSTSELVEVNAEVPLIEPERSQQSDTIEERSVRNLPINRRDYLTFTLLAPGVADSSAMADANTFRVKQTPDSGLSFYGSNGRGNNVAMDGSEANDDGGGVRPTVSQEAVQEFQINRADMNAEHGSARGGVINIVTKSGTNATHGSVFGFFRNQALDAGNPFAIVLPAGATTATRVKPDSSRQQFGGTIGGPITKDRTFYFVSYEQLRRRESAAIPLLTNLAIFDQTAGEKALLAQLNALPPLAPLAGSLNAALKMSQPTMDMFQKNSGVFPFQTDQYQGLIRLDHRINASNQLNLRLNVTHVYDTNQNLSGLVGYSRGYIQDTFDGSVGASWLHTFTPRLINELRTQFDYYNPFTGTNDPYGPAFEIAGFGAFNRDRFLPNDTISRHEEIVDNVSIARGTHNFKVGTQILIRNNRSESATFMSGRFTFGPLPVAGILIPTSVLPTLPQPIRDQIVGTPTTPGLQITALQAFNLGVAQSYQQGWGDPTVKATYPLYGVFAQDTWKVRPNFTLNYGVRYEVDTRKKPLPTDTNNVAPRFGFAWDPFNDHKTTIRGGYGLFFAPIDFQIDYVVNALNEINGYRQIAQILTSIISNPPPAPNGPVNIFQTLVKQGVIGIPTPKQPIRTSDMAQFGIFPTQTGPRYPLTVLFHPDPNYQNPYAQQASFGIERQIARGLSLSASYVFVRGAKLTRSRDGNLLPAPINPATGIRDWGKTPVDNPTGYKYFRNPLMYQDNIYESSANSFYHALIVESTGRLSRNVTLHANYTFSKAIDETVDFNSDFQANDQANQRAERALSSFDQRHKFVLYGIFQTPGGLTLTPIFRANSARPFNLLAGGTDLNSDRHNTTDRPMFLGRNTGIGPSFWTADLRLSKRFTFREKMSLELMAEAFNLFNHENFSSVNNNVCAPDPLNPVSPVCTASAFPTHAISGRNPSQPLGYTAVFDPRRIQLGLRFAF